METVAQSAVEVNVQLVVCDGEEDGGSVRDLSVCWLEGETRPGEGATSTTANSTRRKLSRFACPHVANYMTVSPYPASTARSIFFCTASDHDQRATIMNEIDKAKIQNRHRVNSHPREKRDKKRKEEVMSSGVMIMDCRSLPQQSPSMPNMLSSY